MLNQFQKFIKYILRPQAEIVKNNLVTELECAVFESYYVQKKSKSDVQKELNIGRKKLDKMLSIVRQKILLMPEFKFKLKVEEMTEEQIEEKCIKLGKSQEYIQFCKLAFVQGLKKKEIADIMFLDIETVKKYKSIRRKELEN